MVDSYPSSFKQTATRKEETKMKTQSEEAKNLDQFLSDISEVFEIPKRTLQEFMFPFDEEPEIARQDSSPHEVTASRRIPSSSR